MKRDLMRDLYPDDPNGPAGAPELSDLEQRKTEELSLYGSWRRAKQNETINFNRGHVPIDEDDVRYKPLTMSLLLRHPSTRQTCCEHTRVVGSPTADSRKPGRAWLRETPPRARSTEAYP